MELTQPKPDKPQPAKAPEPKAPTMALRTPPPTRSFLVVARHSPCPVKSLTVEAADEGDALTQFCEHNKVHAAEVLAKNKKTMAPQGVADFVANRHLYPDVSVTAV